MQTTTEQTHRSTCTSSADPLTCHECDLIASNQALLAALEAIQWCAATGKGVREGEPLALAVDRLAHRAIAQARGEA